MPFEIMEIIFKAKVDPEGGTGSKEKKRKKSSNSSKEIQAIEGALAQMKNMLKNRNER